MSIERRYICKLINELEEKEQKIGEITEEKQYAELSQDIRILEQQLERSEEITANYKTSNEKLINEKIQLEKELREQKEKEYANTELQKEVDKMEKLINKANKYLSDKNKEVDELQKEISELKENQAPLNTESNTYSVIDIFTKIKKGTFIKSLKATMGRAKGSELSSHPFVLELGNCRAFYNENKFVACMEIHEDGVSEYIPCNVTDCSKHVVSSIREYIGLNMDFKVAQRKDLCGHNETISKTLQKQLLINKDGYICSTEKYTWYIYTEEDGSKFVILPSGEKEVV